MAAARARKWIHATHRNFAARHGWRNWARFGCKELYYILLRKAEKMTVLASYRFLLVPVSIGLLLPAVALPWIVINFLGVHRFSPADIAELYFGETSSQSTGRFDIKNLLSSYSDSYFAAVASLSLYFFSVVGMILSVAWRNQRPTIALIAGSLAIISAILWLYSVHSIKENFSSQAEISGGLIGGEFKGHESTLADILIQLGIGQYFVAAGGATGIFGSLAETLMTKKSQPALA